MAATTFQTNNQGVALDGFDAVSYFAGAAPVAGSVEHKQEWSGATWWFASAENAAAFKENPENFAPQCGGHCAFGASLGREADASAESFRLIEGKLYMLMSNQVKGLSKLFTKRIVKNAAKG